MWALVLLAVLLLAAVLGYRYWRDQQDSADGEAGGSAKAEEGAGATGKPGKKTGRDRDGEVGSE